MIMSQNFRSFASTFEQMILRENALIEAMEGMYASSLFQDCESASSHHYCAHLKVFEPERLALNHLSLALDLPALMITACNHGLNTSKSFFQ
jgi:hypothetical protein